MAWYGIQAGKEPFCGSVVEVRVITNAQEWPNSLHTSPRASPASQGALRAARMASRVLGAGGSSSRHGPAAIPLFWTPFQGVVLPRSSHHGVPAWRWVLRAKLNFGTSFPCHRAVPTGSTHGVQREKVSLLLSHLLPLPPPLHLAEPPQRNPPRRSSEGGRKKKIIKEETRIFC